MHGGYSFVRSIHFLMSRPSLKPAACLGSTIIVITNRCTTHICAHLPSNWNQAALLAKHYGAPTVCSKGAPAPSTNASLWAAGQKLQLVFCLRRIMAFRSLLNVKVGLVRPLHTLARLHQISRTILAVLAATGNRWPGRKGAKTDREKRSKQTRRKTDRQTQRQTDISMSDR